MTRLTKEQILQSWAERREGWSPVAALQRARASRWAVDGVIPANSMVWVVGPPAGGKTFALMGLAVSVASGIPWQGRECDQATVVYVAAEGGDDIQLRWAAAELAAGASGPLMVAQTRPQVGTQEGLAELLSLVQRATGGALSFEVVASFENTFPDKYLEPKELEQYKADGNDDHWLERAASRSTPADRAIFKHWGFETNAPEAAKKKKVLLIIDTFSQTAPNDEKSSVSAFVKNLRELAEQVALAGGDMSIIVVDHLTKSGESYMGSLAKLGDSDVMVVVERSGQLVTLTCPEKMKVGRPFEPIHLELVPFQLEGYQDGLGRPLSTLVTADGERAHRMRKAAGTNDHTAAATVMALLTDTSPSTRDSLRDHFLAHASNEGKRPETVKRAFNRALESLTDDGIIDVVDDIVSHTLA
jgi:hypothetical protein